MVNIEPSWKKNIDLNAPYWETLKKEVKEMYQTKTIYPHPKNLFKAFDLCPFDNVSIVILGQDPYHNPGQANGLAFSVQKDIDIPPSLQNIFKEIKSDIGELKQTDGDLSNWAEQGILLLNSILTVEKNKPASHHNLPWEEFTNDVISLISDKKENVVFILWGNYAKNKAVLIDESKHLILTSPHPSPFSAYSGFFGCKHFSKANNYLVKHNKKPITY